MIAQMRIQIFSVEGCLDLICIGAAHGRDHVGIGETALEHIGIIVALFERVLVENIIRETRPVLDHTHIIETLEAKVVDRDHDLRPCDGRFVKQGAQIDRHQTCLPVVAVDDIRDPVHIVECRQRSLTEIAELRNVVDQVGVGISRAEKFLIVDKVIHDAVPDIFHDADIIALSVRAQIHIKSAYVDHLVLIFLRNAFIPGQNDLDIAVLPDQRLGKRIHDISQTACLDKRIALRADESDAPPGLGKFGSRSFFDHFDGGLDGSFGRCFCGSLNRRLSGSCSNSFCRNCCFHGSLNGRLSGSFDSCLHGSCCFRVFCFFPARCGLLSRSLSRSLLSRGLLVCGLSGSCLSCPGRLLRFLCSCRFSFSFFSAAAFRLFNRSFCSCLSSCFSGYFCCILDRNNFLFLFLSGHNVPFLSDLSVVCKFMLLFL